MSLTPGYQFPDSPIKFSDIFVHLIMYGSWMFVICKELGKQYSPQAHRFEYMMLAFLIFFGLFIEILQESFIEGRYGSVSDSLANSAGAVLSFALFRKRNANRDKSLL